MTPGAPGALPATVFPSQAQAQVQPPAPRFSSAIVLLGCALLVVVLAASSLAYRETRGVLLDLDRRALQQAAGMLEGLIDQQRSQLGSEVSVLADDTRIRATVLSAKFDEPTLRDVLQDLKRSSGASVLAVMNGGGRIRAVAGSDALQDVDLGASALVSAAQQRAATDVWSLPDQVRVIGVAPVRSGERVLALLMKGLTLGEQQLGVVHRTLGVSGAVFVADHLTATTTGEPSVKAAFQVANRIDDDEAHIIESEGKRFVGRAIRTSGATRSGKVVWLVPLHHRAEQVRLLSILIWAPILPAFLIFLVSVLAVRQPGRARA